MTAVLRLLWKQVMDLIFPRRAVCMGCGSMVGCERNELCQSCREKLAQTWIGPYVPVGAQEVDGAAFVSTYEGPAGSLVRRLKYGGVYLLADMMGNQLARSVSLMGLGKDVLVTCVPMHPRRLRRRGQNHARLLALVVARELGMEYRDLLVRVRNTPQQARLDRKSRNKNLKGAFAVDEQCCSVAGRDVLIIDDVFTTGATMIECVRTLRSAGVEKTYLGAYALGGGKKTHG